MADPGGGGGGGGSWGSMDPLLPPPSRSIQCRICDVWPTTPHFVTFHVNVIVSQITIEYLLARLLQAASFIAM